MRKIPEMLTLKIGAFFRRRRLPVFKTEQEWLDWECEG